MQRTALRAAADAGRSAYKMNPYMALLFCAPLPGNNDLPGFFRAKIGYYALCDTQAEFETKIQNLVSARRWDLIEIQTMGETRRERIGTFAREQILRGLDTHGEFEVVLGKVASEN